MHPEQFEREVEAARPIVAGALLRAGCPHVDLEDVTMSAIGKAWRYRGQFRRGCSFTTWLVRIARNCWLDEVRRRSRRPVAAQSDRQSDDGLELADRHEDPKADTFAQAFGGVPSERLGRALSALSPMQRAVLAARTIDGKSISETAEGLGVTVAVVKTSMHRATKILAAELGQPAALTA